MNQSAKMTDLRAEDIVSELEHYIASCRDPYRVGSGEFLQEEINGIKELIDPVRLQQISKHITEFNTSSKYDFWSLIIRNEKYRELLPIRAHIEFIRIEGIRRKYGLR